MTNLIQCPDCETNEFVSANEHADSYYAKHVWNVSCRNKECQKQFWANDHMPRCTDNYDTEQEAIDAWNKGKCYNFPFSTGGRYTGD